VKTSPYLLAVALGLAATAASAQQAYNPVLLNLSTLMDFNPVVGHVKSLNTSAVNDKGEAVYQLSMTLSADGCVQTLNSTDNVNRMQTVLVKEGNALKGTQNGNPLSFTLDSKCNLLSRDDSAGHLDFVTNAQGQLKSVMLGEQKIVDHFYDADGNLIKAEFYASGMVASSNSVTYPDSVNKPVDYTLVNQSAYQPGFRATNACQYDKRHVPTLCHVTVMPEKGQPAPMPNMTVTTQASFY